MSTLHPERLSANGTRLPELQVRRVSVMVRERGYVDAEERTFQQLGYVENGFLGPCFKVVDEEEIPADVLVDIACFGATGTGWKSRFLPWIPESRGGTMKEGQAA